VLEHIEIGLTQFVPESLEIIPERLEHHYSTKRVYYAIQTKDSVFMLPDTVSTVLRYLPLPTGRSIPLIPDLPVLCSGTSGTW
jgi:hypothetical protein